MFLPGEEEGNPMKLALRKITMAAVGIPFLTAVILCCCSSPVVASIGPSGASCHQSSGPVAKMACPSAGHFSADHPDCDCGHSVTIADSAKSNALVRLVSAFQYDPFMPSLTFPANAGMFHQSLQEHCYFSESLIQNVPIYLRNSVLRL
jgi:hypothetical protein